MNDIKALIADIDARKAKRAREATMEEKRAREATMEEKNAGRTGGCF